MRILRLCLLLAIAAAPVFHKTCINGCEFMLTPGGNLIQLFEKDHGHIFNSMVPISVPRLCRKGVAYYELNIEEEYEPRVKELAKKAIHGKFKAD